MKKLKLLIDMDAVTADIYESWLPLLNQDYGDSLTKDNITDWDISNCCLAGQNAFTYLYEPNFFVNLKPMPYAVEVLYKLYNEGFEIFYVTAPMMDSVHAFPEKIEWVKTHTPFIPLENIIFTHRKDLVDGHILFDDSPKNLQNFPRIAIAYAYTFNKDVDCPRVSGWPEFYSIVHQLAQ